MTTTATTIETVPILELDQGHYQNLSGMPVDDAIVMFKANDAEFHTAHPNAIYGYPCWRQLTVAGDARCRWGCEWYRIDPTGTLVRWQANLDSSG